MNTPVVTTPEMIDTPVLKTPDSTKPAIEIITDDKIANNFIPTGITVVIPTNLAKVNSEAIFACNIDGFIPFLNTTYNRPSLWKNLFPIQVTRTGNNIAGLRVIYEFLQMPVQMKYMSYRYVSGNVKVGIRISSQTGQIGNWYVTQMRAASRLFYNASTGYEGLKFCNASFNSVDYSPSSFTIADLSLNRNLSITPCRTNPLIKQDMAKKLVDVYRFDHDSPSDQYSTMTNQHAEDWLLFEPVMNLSGQTASEVFMTFFFDYSNVNFEERLYPIIPISPRFYDLQMLLYTETFKGQEGKEDYNDWIWYPRDVSTVLSKQYPKEIFGNMAIGGQFEINKIKYNNCFAAEIKPKAELNDGSLYSYFRKLPLFKHKIIQYSPSNDRNTTV
jgi:hypothetical protein